MRMYELAKEKYAALGVDTEKAIAKLSQIPISVHCWQGDDVGGFEAPDAALSGGIAATGNYPGKAATAGQLRADIEKAFSFIGGKLRLSLHAIYAETDGRKVERNNLQPAHFAAWIEWAKAQSVALDFNPTLFSHPMAASGFTLSSIDKGVRDFWIEHCIACREIADYMGRTLGGKTITNIWIPDGFKDIPVDRYTPRKNLADALDKILAKPTEHNLDSVESKVFGIGAESATIGSHEFYMGYAVSRQVLLTLDMGHFHPTEAVSDKISGVIDYVPGILLHVSRPVRWDSDHVVILDDELQTLMTELARHDLFDKVHIGLDFFDASINRIAAWVIGIRNSQKALLKGLLEPTGMLASLEASGDYTSRLAMLEELKAMPWCAVWDEFCAREGVAAGYDWLSDVKQYESDVLSKR